MNLLLSHPSNPLPSTARHRQAAIQHPLAGQPQHNLNQCRSRSNSRHHHNRLHRAAATPQDAANPSEHPAVQQVQQPQARRQAGLLLSQAPALKAPLQHAQLADFRYSCEQRPSWAVLSSCNAMSLFSVGPALLCSCVAAVLARSLGHSGVRRQASYELLAPTQTHKLAPTTPYKCKS
jgi:hypothetical protein